MEYVTLMMTQMRVEMRIWWLYFVEKPLDFLLFLYLIYCWVMGKYALTCIYAMLIVIHR